MTIENIMAPAAPDGKEWGWQQAGCRGEAALALFIDDLHRILQAQAANRLAVNDNLRQAQAQVDDLVRRYTQIAGAPEIFDEQSVELKEGMDRNGVSHTIPIFSPRLKNALVSMLRRGTG